MSNELYSISYSKKRFFKELLKEAKSKKVPRLAFILLLMLFQITSMFSIKMHDMKSCYLQKKVRITIRDFKKALVVVICYS